MNWLMRLHDWLFASSKQAAIEALSDFDSYDKIDIIIAACTAGELSVALRSKQEKMKAYKEMIGNWGDYRG